MLFRTFTIHCIQVFGLGRSTTIVMLVDHQAKLRSITIPKGVSEIKPGTFNGCCSLRSLSIPELVTSIGEAAFQRCSSLTSLDIPESVVRVEDLAFAGCTSLSSVTAGKSGLV